MINKDQLQHVITEVLTAIDMCSLDAVSMLMGTAAVESNLGEYLYQIGGPALGIFQMEPNTERDIWGRYLYFRTKKSNAIATVTGVSKLCPFALKTNLAYQIAMARVLYLRVSEPIPDSGDIEGQALYWKKHYNTRLGKGTAKKYVEKWHRYIG
ncbi:MAG: hypothetical protein KJ630_19185 [Proteobacteria bacterium]|nr:hypothetical protein [Pseudomonadota bacterium]